MDNFAPAFNEPSFRCPNCSAYAQQHWARQLNYTDDLAGTQTRNVFEQKPDNIWGDIARATCLACTEDSVWKKDDFLVPERSLPFGTRQQEKPSYVPVTRWVMIWPKESNAPLAHEELPESLRQLHAEARAVLTDSPRAAAALLRLLMEKLLQDATGEAGNLNTQIGLLVKRGTFDQRLQETADTIRVSGNTAVHPAEIQSQGDTAEVALAMFELVNFLVEDLIARPGRITHLYQSTVTGGALDAISRRDGDKG